LIINKVKWFLVFMLVCSPVWGAVDFDGTDDYLSITTMTVVSTDFTVYCLANVSITGSISMALYGTNNNAVAGGRGFSFKVEQYNNTGFVGITFGGVGDYATAIAPPTTYAVYVARHDDSANEIEIDVDQSNETIAVGEMLIASIPTRRLIGAWRRATINSIADYTNGDIYECAEWNVLLTDSEVSLLVNSKVKRMPLQIQPANLTSYWAMDDVADGASADGVTFLDMSRNANNATGVDGANNTGLTAVAETVLSYTP